jgi:hypothetical protein
LNAQVLLPRGGESKRATTIGWSKHAEGIPFGKSFYDPILGTREYLARFDNGVEQVYAANLIAENRYAQVDHEGHHFSAMKKIIDHHKVDDSAP